VGVVFRGEVVIPLPIEEAWDLWTNAARLPQWQSGITRVRDVVGSPGEAEGRYVLDAGPGLSRSVRVLVAERPVRHVIEQVGLGVRDETSATFEPAPGGTVLRVAVYSHLNLVMRVVTRFQMRKVEREFQRELERLAALPLRPVPTAEPGGVYVADAGSIRRRLTVLAVEPDRIHVRLHPGHLGPGDPDDRVPNPPRPLGIDLMLLPIAPPIRASLEATASGLPFLRLDGGQGVPHLALALDAWADAAARQVSTEFLTEDDAAAVAAWQVRRAPTVGIDADLGIAPLCTFVPDADSARAAKVVRAGLLRMELLMYANWFPQRPERLRPWELRPWLELDDLEGPDPGPDASSKDGDAPRDQDAPPGAAMSPAEEAELATAMSALALPYPVPAIEWLDLPDSSDSDEPFPSWSPYITVQAHEYRGLDLRFAGVTTIEGSEVRREAAGP
jgi:hypothetical protein